MKKNYIIESLCCTEEINTTLSINSTSIKFSKKKNTKNKRNGTLSASPRSPLPSWCPSNHRLPKGTLTSHPTWISSPVSFLSVEPCWRN